MIHLDRHEPPTIYDLIKQSYPVQWQGLNDMGFADAVWHDYQGEAHQLERKQAREYLSKPEEVEEQLHRQLDVGVAATTSLAIEGMIGPHPTGCVAYSSSKDGKVMYQVGTFRRPYSAVLAKLIAYQEIGITVHIVPSWQATASLICALYKRSQDAEDHTTFQRHIKVQPHIMEYNPYILTLMGVHNGGIGEELGKALIGRYGTPFEVFRSSENELANTPLIRSDGDTRRRGYVGPAKAKQLLRAIGREL